MGPPSPSLKLKQHLQNRNLKKYHLEKPSVTMDTSKVNMHAEVIKDRTNGRAHSGRAGVHNSPPAVIEEKVCLSLGEVSYHYLIHIINSSLAIHHPASKYVFHSMRDKKKKSPTVTRYRSQKC